MIRDVHTTTLRELVAQAERDLAGYRRMLELAEREARVGQVLPDPMTPASAPWAPPQMPVDLPAGPPLGGREPYPTTVMPAIDGSTLPPSQEAAIGAIWSEHDQHATSPKGVREDEQWRNA